jgi:transposase-like protein
MEREWLASQLEAGRSIESIAREIGRNPSTVAYWVNKYGLTSRHASKHRAKGPIGRERLEVLVQEGKSIRQIAAELNVSAATIRHWLRQHGLETRPNHYMRRGEPKPATILRECALHGWTTFAYGGGRYRCARCNNESVAARRRRVKEILVNEAGGCCRLCGFDRYVGALQFHHLDRAGKAFSLSRQGVTRSLERAREEARKCVLLCANCHAMVEAGLLQVAAPADYPG